MNKQIIEDFKKKHEDYAYPVHSEDRSFGMYLDAVEFLKQALEAKDTYWKDKIKECPILEGHRIDCACDAAVAMNDIDEWKDNINKINT